MEAGKHTSQQREHYTSKGWSLGANVGVNGSGIIGVQGSINQAKQKGNTDSITYTGTTVTATNTTSITSGNDTTIVGSKVVGDHIEANIGGNLSITSLQDEKTYTGESSSKGLSLSTNGGAIGNVSFANNKGSMNSNYKSVTEQAGLYAGDKGFAVNTKGTTSLVGAVIHSDAEADKNSLITGSLHTEDIQNTAEYTSRNTGVSYTHRGDFKHLSQAGKDAVWNTLGLLPVLQPDTTGDAQSTTNSAISSGTIKVTNNSANLDQLSRDTENSLNKLDEIFDKKKVEERRELSQLFAKEAFAQLHDWNPTSPEGKAAKAIAHGIVAEMSARIAGNKAGSGFYAGATNEALIGEIQKVAKDNPAVAQWLSASIGAVVNAGMGNSTVTGAAVAQYGTKWNEYQNIKEIQDKLMQLKAGTYRHHGKPFSLNDIRSGEWLLLTGIDPITNEYRGVVINNSGQIVDLHLAEKFVNEQSIGVVTGNSLFMNNNLVANGSGQTYTVNHEEYMINPYTNKRVDSGEIVKYEFGEFDGNLYDEDIFSKARPSLSRIIRGYDIKKDINSIDIKRTPTEYILQRLKKEGYIPDKFKEEFKFGHNSKDFVIQSSNGKYSIPISEGVALINIGRDEYQKLLERTKRIGANKEGAVGLGLNYKSINISTLMTLGMDANENVYIGGEVAGDLKISLEDVYNYISRNDTKSYNISRKNQLEVTGLPLTPYGSQWQNEQLKSGGYIDIKGEYMNILTGNLAEGHVKIGYKQQIEPNSTLEARTFAESYTNGGTAAEWVAIGYDKEHPGEGEFYVSKFDKTKQINKGHW